MEEKKKLTLGDALEGACMTIIVVGFVGAYLFKVNGKMLLNNIKDSVACKKKK